MNQVNGKSVFWNTVFVARCIVRVLQVPVRYHCYAHVAMWVKNAKKKKNGIQKSQKVLSCFLTINWWRFSGNPERINDFPKKHHIVWPRWRIRTATVMGWCSIEVVSGVFGICSDLFPIHRLLWIVHVHFDCASSQETARGRGVWHFPSNFWNKMVLVNCPCEFRLRKVVQNIVRGRSVRHLPCKSPCAMEWFLWEKSTCISTAQSLTKRCPGNCPRPCFL